MKLSTALFFSLSVSCMSLYGTTMDTIADDATGSVFPRVESFAHAGKTHTLQATGVATRKKFFAKVYSVAHYMEDGADLSGNDKFQAIVDANVAKQLSLKWVRNVKANKVQSGYHDGFKRTLGNKLGSLKNEVDTFVGFFAAGVKNKDEHQLKWSPDGNVEVFINGTSVGNISNVDFAKGLWNIWFGEDSIVDREALISQLK